MRAFTLDSLEIPSQLRTAIQDFIGESLDKYKRNIIRMVLYGSVARGDAVESSDVDLLVVWDGSALEAMDALGEIALRILLDYGLDISIHPMTPEHFDHVKRINTHFIRNIYREGIAVA